MNEAVNLKGEKLIVLTEAEYQTIVEDAGDAALAEQAIIENEGAPSMPSELVLASLNGELHPLAAWRKSVGLTQAELAAKAGVRAASVSDIESRKIDPRLSTLRALAKALKLGIEDIVD
ncbi:helix-turn-helix transcriptional regulator [Aurantimonas sp. VKM B-3413]|uniref:helix-turn-helix transcriptional regulator n=1 Tax=Aurantimonas sp. VKM B-3413 TaxID=2779401 RepID=UPI001E339C18|nr:helix-turn-helix transcriptional regulator [Aurantimonas sp. VKM B-3413]MCB8837675.1 helix-turn-helix transcriptional regulator [Aurantimonas sp. VKM B-3413]